MKNIQVLWVGACVFLCSLAGASAAHAMDFQDPTDLMGQVDQYLAQPTFAQAFKMGDVATYSVPNNNCQFYCQDGGCSTLCMNSPATMSRTVSALTADQCTIELQDGTTEVWTPAQFTSMNGNSVREALTTLEQQIVGVSGTLEATSIRDLPYTMPSGQVLQGKEIVFTFNPTAFQNASFFVRYTVVNSVPFVGQIVQMAINGQWRYQLSTVTRQ